MKIYKQRFDKKKISFFIGIFFALFLILSFFSINNVFGSDSEITTSIDNDTNFDIFSSNDSNQNNDSENTTIILNESIYTNTTINSQGTVDKNNVIREENFVNPKLEENASYLDEESDFTSDKNININYKTKDIYYQIDGDNFEKIELKSTNFDNFDESIFYSSLQYYIPNDSDDYYVDINNHINKNIAFLISSYYKEFDFEHFNNFIKDVSNYNFNKVTNNNDSSIIQDFQSCPEPIFNILLFIKIFMEYHDNGKEHLNSF